MHDYALAIAVRLARRWEGLRLRAYKCPAGIWTIGYGHTGPEVVEGLVWTLPEAEQGLQDDMGKALAQALVICPTLSNASVERQAAIADFVFNLGGGRLQASTLRRTIKAGYWEAVPGELRKWVWGGGRKLPGLILRREAEIALCLTS